MKAEEIIRKFEDCAYPSGGSAYSEDDVLKAMHEYGLLCYKKALEDAAENVMLKEESVYNSCSGNEFGSLYSKEVTIDKQSILDITPILP